jgi:anaerobic magnesium-protoporphyrin IX monomethyl ester cyclase
MKHILLIYPNYGWMEDNIHPAAPLGIAYLAAALQDQGIGVDVHDMTWDKNLDPVRRSLAELQPEIVGIQMLSHNMTYVNDLIPRIKRMLPHAKIVAGGPHPTVVSQNIKGVDCVIQGEAEITLPKLIKEDNLQGVHVGEIPDIDEIPIPARELLPMKKYLDIPFIEPLPFPTTNIMTSRGCYFKCKFCYPLSEKIFQKVRFRNVKLVVDEIEKIQKDYHLKGLDIEDDLFVFDEKRIRQFNREMFFRSINISWRANCRADTITEKKAQLMAESGCVELIFGIESGSQKILNNMNKGITTEQIRKAIKICQDAGIITMTNYVIGFPGETNKTLKETEEMIKELKSDIVDINIANPMPGTWLYDYCLKKGLTNITDYKQYSRTYAGGIHLSELTPEELDMARDDLTKIYYKYIFKNLRPHFTKAMTYRTTTLLQRPAYLAQLMVNYAKALIVGKERKQVK